MVEKLVRVARGLYRPSQHLATPPDHYAALLSVLPEGTVVAGLAAAHLHKLWLPDIEPPHVPDVIVTSGGARPRDRARSVRPEVRSRRRYLRPDERCLAGGVPATTALRTWIDLAPGLGLFDLVAAGDCVLRRGVTADQVERAVRRARGQRGVAQLRTAKDLLDGRSASRPESHLRCALVTAGLPRPEVNTPIYDDHGGWLAEPDLHYARARIAIEYNGAGHADRRQMRKDITRELDVEHFGWRVVVFGPAQVFGRPDVAAARVRALLDERDPGWRRRTDSVATCPVRW